VVKKLPLRGKWNYIKGLTKPGVAYKLSKYLIENNGYDPELIHILKKMISQ